MKQIITKLTLVAVIASLTACSTNTQEQNTMIGAGTGAVAGGLLGSIAKGAGSGWVIAAGAVVGALVGGVIGNSMDSSDCMQASSAMSDNAIDQPANWQNNQTGNTYKIVPTSGYFKYHQYQSCRHYIAYGKSHGQAVETKGIACRMDDGMWKQVR